MNLLALVVPSGSAVAYALEVRAEWALTFAANTAREHGGKVGLYDPATRDLIISVTAGPDARRCYACGKSASEACT